MAYQDYVIKDGKFIGKFEEMYQDYEDPWVRSKETEVSYNNKHDTYHTIKRFELRNVLEVGCGLGHFTNKLASSCPDTKFTGMDISETAINKATANYASLKFVVRGIKPQRTFQFTRV